MNAPTTAVTPPESVHGEIVVMLDRPAAEKLDGRIRRLATATGEQLVRVGHLLDEAKAGRVHEVLGYPSWPAYVADALGGTLQLSGEARQAMVALMSSEGMSLRAIATATGVSKDTVSRDLAEVSHDETPAGQPQPSATVTGLDGKAHPRHRPAPIPTPVSKPRRPPRKPIGATFSVAHQDMEKAVAKLRQIADDDRFGKFARESASDDDGGYLARWRIDAAIAALQEVRDRFPESTDDHDKLDGQPWLLGGKVPVVPWPNRNDEQDENPTGTTP
ncbi:hypothetical protein C3473_28295 [Mycobacterium kansasii]|uniref:helix-turn-helix domain-containing protein n=1 Tax=Mycobacterium kansasii TaxID=1768 RepID=UPI000CDD64FE|nr:helix-turn-helix domain-containing protein [Mycobacterium kansasii]POX87615.1 hypothetical protein C3473_28295 [Mycobacterium kansasii]